MGIFSSFIFSKSKEKLRTEINWDQVVDKHLQFPLVNDFDLAMTSIVEHASVLTSLLTRFWAPAWKLEGSPLSKGHQVASLYIVFLEMASRQIPKHIKKSKLESCSSTVWNLGRSRFSWRDHEFHVQFFWCFLCWITGSETEVFISSCNWWLQYQEGFDCWWWQ